MWPLGAFIETPTSLWLFIASPLAVKTDDDIGRVCVRLVLLVTMLHELFSVSGLHKLRCYQLPKKTALNRTQLPSLADLVTMGILTLKNTPFARIYIDMPIV